MDENFCENEIKENVDDEKERKTKGDPEMKKFGALAITGKPSRHQVSNPYGSSLDTSVSGPSTNFYSLIRKDNNAERSLVDREPEQATEIRPQTRKEAAAPIHERVETLRENAMLAPSVFNICEPREPREPRETREPRDPREPREPREPHVLEPFQIQEQLSAKRGTIGPPPSYSFVMKQKKKMKRVPSPDILLANRPPPPNYAGTRGLYITSEERTFGFPSFAEPIWRSHSQPALCPRCGIIVLTTAHSHESIATHVAALALCLFGCWPCCLLPYCMNICKNTYHYCPICQTLLGLYTPW